MGRNMTAFIAAGININDKSPENVCIPHDKSIPGVHKSQNNEINHDSLDVHVPLLLENLP